MDQNNGQNRGQWNSKLGFVLAASGSAVGLGNIWRFPFMAGANGGGAFVLVYFILLIIIGFTLMLGELSIGRATQLSPIGAYRKLKAKYAWIGALGVVAGFLILSFYSVIGGWVIRYLVKAISGDFNVADGSVLGGLFVNFITNPLEPLVYHGIFMVLTLLIVIGGVSKGIERYSKILMPMLFVMMVLLMFRSLTLPGAMEGVKFLLVPDFSKINAQVVLAALGQVFFSLSLGMGTMITYGSYLRKDENLISSSIEIPLIDTAIAFIAGLAILPAVFAFGFDPEGGPGLLFITLPAVFSQMPLGSIFAILFFLLVLFSCTNLVFPAVFPDARTGVPLVVAAIVAWVGFWSVHVSSSATFEPRLLVAFLLGLTLVSVGAHLSRTVIPPAPLSLASAGVGPRLLSDGVLALAVTRIHPSELHELHAVTEVTVLDGRGEGLLHEWRCEGVLIARNPVTPIRVREHGGRVRLWSSLDQSQLPVRAEGSWTLTVLTPDERPIGRVVFEVLADP